MDGIAVMADFDHALCNICPVSPPDEIHKVEVVTVIFVLGRSFRPNWFLFVCILRGLWLMVKSAPVCSSDFASRLKYTRSRGRLSVSQS